MATGIPIISTDVGSVRDAFGERQEEFILKERTKEELKTKLKYLLEHFEILEKLSKENIKQIQNWSWENKCQQFREFFKKNL